MRLPAFKRFALSSFPITLLIGVILTFIKWGDQTGGHGLYGQGIPIPAVFWDNPPQYNGRFVDYPNPLAIILNPLVIYGLGILIFGISKACSIFLIRHSSQQPPARTRE